jgi:hypothetical protein
MRGILLLWAAVLAISGCTSDPHAIFASPGAIMRPIYDLKGHTADAAIAYLGSPNSESKLDTDRRVLVWNATAPSHTSGERVVTTQCTIRAVVGTGNIVSSVEIDTRSAYYCPRGQRSPPLKGPLGQ